MLLVQHARLLYRKIKDFSKMFILNLYLEKKLSEVLGMFCF